MCKLLEMQQCYPPSIFFMNGERLQDDGLDVRQSHFLLDNPPSWPCLNDNRAAICFNRVGLLVVYPDLFISVPKKPLTEVFLLLDRDAEPVYLVMRQDEPSASLSWDT